MPTKLTCPACGSPCVICSQAVEYVAVPYGIAIQVNKALNRCAVCFTEGDFAGVNDAVVDAALLKSKQAAIQAILKYLADAGFTLSYILRALRLSLHAGKRWRKGRATDAELTLLSFVRAYPWLLEVSDNNFKNVEKET